jgi:hypothetical protein
MSRLQQISTIFMILFLLCSSKNLSSKSSTGLIVAKKLSECWGHQIGIGRKLKDDPDVSHVALSLSFSCRINENSLRGVEHMFKLHECLFDNIWVMNYNGKRYQTCGSFQPVQIQDGESPHLKMTCKNLGTDNYEIIDVDFSPFFSVTKGVPKCIKPYPK